MPGTAKLHKSATANHRFSIVKLLKSNADLIMEKLTPLSSIK